MKLAGRATADGWARSKTRLSEDKQGRCMDSGRWEGDALCRQALTESFRDMLCAWELTDGVGLLSDLRNIR